ncbi:response regulator [Aquimarina sp. 2201CG5-10]|uniref:response regulator n=1 Tax=Aquimarina callyspongiae TaxID=3098150 RepID=UPI002AB366A9|nr:response regulator [Aquimarina sp. 2201CG5-10]MDY8138161.1 ATP-binding protein [Aquimarina sp. 2201CG5-10]
MRKISWFKTEAAKYTLYGVLFGFAFPILATSIDIVKLGLEFNWSSIVFVQKNYPIHYIIDTAPFFLGLFAMFGGRNLDKLRDKNEQILKASKFKQDFLAHMSHEIRTPMVGVIGMIDLLFKNTQLNELQKEYVNTIHQSSYNLLDILNQILDLSKMEAGKFVLSPTNFNFKNLINQNINLFLATSKAKGIQLISEYQDELSEYIFADCNRLNQVISNLIGNAIKFSNEGSIVIKTSLISQKNDTAIIKVEVIDSGIGISKKDQEELFNQYNQFSDDAILAGEGSGLGLTICKKLVTLMDGKLGVKSELGKGSNFWFTFNAKISSTINDKQEKIRFSASEQKYNLHVLLVEDSDTSILVSKQILKYLGCTTEVAKNGRKAIEIFEEDVFDLILMDINLPELDGVQTCELLRKSYSKVPPIIALTSNALPGDAERYIAKGLDDYITKPFTTEILNIKLKNWFGDHFGNH